MAVEGPGASAMNFLNIGVSARSAATGEAFSAVSDGPVSSYYNPAGLAGTENIQIAGMHSEWLQDLRYEYLGFALPVGQRGGLGLSFSYLTFGRIDGYSQSNEPLGNIGAYDMAAGVSYGHRISQRFSVGIGIKGIGEKLDDVTAFGFAGDMGIRYDSDKYIVGLSLMNLGPKIKYELSSSPLPSSVNGGVSYFPLATRHLAIMAGAAMPFSGDFAFRAGIEYSIQDLLVLRSGYDSQDNSGGDNGFSFGGGLNLSVHSLDYAYNINSRFGGTHQISFVLKLGQPREAAAYHAKVHLPVKQSVEEREQRPTDDDLGSIYQVCAAKYSDKKSAEKHIDTLKMFGISAKFILDADGVYRIVLKESDSREKAEKAKDEFEKKGISCFVEVE
jgi:hypothetical protein